MTLVEFLRARLDEDERAARRAARFKYDQPKDAPWERSRLAVEQDMGLSSDEHIARHDPARVLRDVEAKRRIVEAHAEHESVPHFCRTCGSTDGPCETKRLLALPYADHPEFQEEWRVA